MTLKKILNFLLDARNSKWLWVGFACLLGGTFLVLTSEMREYIGGRPELIGRIDEWTLVFLADYRAPSLNSIAVDITALGSGSVLTILVIGFLIYYSFDRTAGRIWHLIICALGSSLITSFLKNYFERSRPPIIQQLVAVQGYSYPSGHSLSSAAIYFTLAIMCSQSVRGKLNRLVCIAAFSFLIGIIGISRIYLGVHYFSDVSAGILLGVAWASLLSLARAFLKDRY